jgi:hypothetical protein
MPTATMDCYWFSTAENQVEGSIDILVECLLSQQVVIMSDGLMKGTTAGASWIITTECAYDKGCFIQGKSLLPEG